MPPRNRKPDTRTGDRHKHDPLTIRLAEPVWMRLKAFADRVGKTERAIGAEAVTEYLDKHDPDTPNSEERP